MNEKRDALLMEIEHKAGRKNQELLLSRDKEPSTDGKARYDYCAKCARRIEQLLGWLRSGTDDSEYVASIVAALVAARDFSSGLPRNMYSDAVRDVTHVMELA